MPFLLLSIPGNAHLQVTFCPRAYAITRSAGAFSVWAGRRRTESQDLLMALAAGGVLDGLFPDCDLSFDRVRRVCTYRWYI